MTDEAKIKKYEKEIKALTKEKMKTGKSHQGAKCEAYAEVRQRAFKVLGFVPDGFYWEKIHPENGE